MMQPFLTRLQVPHVEIPVYGQRQYPGLAPQSYPKTDAPELPKVTLSIFNKADKRLKVLNVTAEPRLITVFYKEKVNLLQ